MPKRGFLTFWSFLVFFSECSCPGRVRPEFGTKIFSLLLGQSHPVWAKNSARNEGFSFFSFFHILTEFSFPGWVWTKFGAKIFFFSFSAYLIPFWLKIMLEWCFLICWIFFLFFAEFSYPGRVWTEFGTKFFFSLPQLNSSRLG